MGRQQKEIKQETTLKSKTNKYLINYKSTYSANLNSDSDMGTKYNTFFGINLETYDLAPHLRVGSALESASDTEIPNDIIDSMLENGVLSDVKEYYVERIQTTFHESLKLERMNNIGDIQTFCLQFLGAKLSDKPVFHHQRPVCAE